MGFRCIYRGNDEPQENRSLEHIWPEALGGQSAPDIFKTREVCERCNNLSGLFIDGEFIRSFFAGVEQSQSGFHFIDTLRPVALPLVYMGNHEDPAPAKGEVCESWLGPRGERIFYFHQPDRTDFYGYAGGDPIRRKHEDAGRVYLSFSRANMYWIASAILSVKQTFANAGFRLLTVIDHPDILAQCAAEDEQSAIDRAYIAPLLAEKTAHLKLSFSIDHGHRFQCKLALGFGHTLFGPQFGETPYAGKLRKALWERDGEKRGKLEIFGTPLLANLRDQDEKILGLKGAYTFVFVKTTDGAMSLIYGPSTRSLRTVIAREAPTLRSQLLDSHEIGRAHV